MSHILRALLVAGLAFAQGAGAIGSSRVTGVATDSYNQPLLGATVSLLPDLLATINVNAVSSLRTYSATAGANGQFVIEQVVPGVYHLVERRGFLPQGYGGLPGSVAGIPLDVFANQPVTDLKVALSQPGVISGRLSSGQHQPVSHLRVSAARWRYSGGQRRLQIEGSGSSDDTGSFRISGLVPGQYFVYAEADLPGTIKPTTGPAKKIIVPTYFPSATDLGGAAAVLVTAGGESHADIEVREVTGYTVSGTVTGARSRPAAGAVVVVLRDRGAPVLAPETRTSREIRDSPPYWIVVRTDAMGHYTIPNLPPGTHRIAALGGTRIELNLGSNSQAVFNNVSQGLPEDDGTFGITQVTVRDESLRDLIIRLEPGVEVIRNTRIEQTTFADILKSQWKRDGEGPPADFAAKMLAQEPQVKLVPEEPISAGGWFPPSSGHAVQKVSPGRYLVEVSGMPIGVYTKSIRLSGMDVTRRRLDLVGGSIELEILLAQGTGRVEGAVTDSKGRPVTGATVTLWPTLPDANSPAQGALSATAGQDGRFSIHNLAPGEYYALAFENLSEPGVGTYPGSLGMFSGQATKVKLEPFGRCLFRRTLFRQVPPPKQSQNSGSDLPFGVRVSTLAELPRELECWNERCEQGRISAMLDRAFGTKV